MKTIKQLFTGMLVLAALSACQDDDRPSGGNDNSDEVFSQNFGPDVSRDFFGRILDMDGQPISGAEVKIGNSTTQTDINGVFLIEDAQVREKFAYIKANKAGFIEGSRTMVPTSGINNVTIMMIPSVPVATIQSGENSTVALSSGTNVKFDGVFQTLDGSAYSGTVQVSMFHLEASDEHLGELMPGSLYAATQQGEQAVLQTFGMLNVELRGSGGQILQLASGHTAEIEMMIDATQMATAPASIPLWHFDEQKGYWKEEGSAVKVGNKYVAEVSHFSWWNCDLFSQLAWLRIKVVQSDSEQPLASIAVQLVAQTWPSNTLTTASDGTVSGAIPANIPLTVKLFTPYGEVLLTQELPAFSPSIIIQEVVLSVDLSNNPAIALTTLFGTVGSCTFQEQAPAYVQVKTLENFVLANIPVVNSAVSQLIAYNVNEPEVQISALTQNGNNISNINYTLTSPITNIGQLYVCDTITEFLNYKIDDGPIVSYYSNFSVSSFVNAPGFYITGTNGQQQNIYLTSNTSTPGLYTTNTIQVQGTNVYLGPSVPNTVVFNLSSYGAVGEFIDLTISGTYTDNTGTHTVTGNAHVKRDF